MTVPEYIEVYISFTLTTKIAQTMLSVKNYVNL